MLLPSDIIFIVLWSKDTQYSKEMWCYLDDKWVMAPCLGPQDRGFQYGDGVFETIIVWEGQVLFATEHYERLQKGANELGLCLPACIPSNPIAFAHWLERIVVEWEELSKESHLYWRLKLVVWRYPGGLYGAMHPEAHCLVMIQPQAFLYEGQALSVTIYKDYRLHSHPLSSVKCLHALPYVLAARYAQRAGFDDALLLDVDGHLAEATSSNVFWMIDEVFYTPSLDTGCVAGVMRRQWLRYLGILGVECREVRVSVEEVMAEAQACWLVNIAGVRRVCAIEKHRLNENSEKQKFVEYLQSIIWQEARQSR